MIPYAKQIITQKDISLINKVLKSDIITQGEQKLKFEKKLSKMCKSKYAVSFNSATSALHMSCLALGVGKGDWVWTSTNSFVASANCALYCNAKIDLIDINFTDFNLDIDILGKKLAKAKKLNKLPKVVIPVHLGGLPPNLEKLNYLKKKYKFKIIEDASHSIGAKFKNSIVGSCKYSDITVFSFHPVKIITTAEGGAALTNSKIIRDKLSELGFHGITRDKTKFHNKKKGYWYYEQQALGYNYKINEIQTALGYSQLDNLKKWVSRRNFIAKKYLHEFRNLPFYVQQVGKNIRSSYHLFVIVLKKNKFNVKRDDILNKLKKNNIFANLHYIPIHKQPFYKKFSFKSKDFKNANYYFENSISLPMYAGLKDIEQNKVIKIIKNIFKIRRSKK